MVRLGVPLLDEYLEAVQAPGSVADLEKPQATHRVRLLKRYMHSMVHAAPRPGAATAAAALQTDDVDGTYVTTYDSYGMVIEALRNGDERGDPRLR